MSEQLPDTFIVSLPEPLLKTFEYEFRSANHNLMAEVVMALRTIIGELIKALDGGREDYGDLKTETTSEFMLKHYTDVVEGIDVLNKIGVQSASRLGLRSLANLPLTATYSCLSLFCRWVDEAYYAYNMLPFPFKVHLTERDKLALEQLNLKWTDTKFKLKEELQQLTDVLKQSEQNIISQVNEAINVNSILIYTAYNSCYILGTNS